MDGPGNSRLKIVSLDTELSIKTIPNELIIEILSRVPAKSIATCRRVLKEWKSLLLTPAFTDSFLAISSVQPRILLTFKCSGKWHFCTAPQPQHLGKLCAVVYSGSHGELWVLDDIQKEKWSKHSFDSPNTDFEEVKSTWATDTGEIAWVLSRWKNPFHVFFYNLDSKCVRRVEIKGIDDKVLLGKDRVIQHLSVTSYVENVMIL
ncbi:hypothetical protein F2Q69_00030579 [Brassica cretica]|uniref:F-box domain-containing protein n=1 Tax=Brassica cretica TaxID=69181 RepID=A0A8S9S0P7_BRACR|nr:hypothetical protein F2Q69_00030579 [Brassica cretica]